MKPTHKWMPVIDEDKCSGCGLCVSACGPACLGMSNGLALLTLPEACGSEEHCIGVCADDAIQMAWLPWIGDTSRGKWHAGPAGRTREPLALPLCTGSQAKSFTS